VQLILAGGVIAGVYLSYRNLSVAQETLATTRAGQLPERFTRAIDRLGAYENERPNLEMRLGAIHASRASNRPGSDLSGADLEGAALGGTNLSGAKLGFVNVSGAVFEQANLTGAHPACLIEHARGQGESR